MPADCKSWVYRRVPEACSCTSSVTPVEPHCIVLSPRPKYVVVVGIRNRHEGGAGVSETRLELCLYPSAVVVVEVREGEDETDVCGLLVETAIVMTEPDLHLDVTDPVLLIHDLYSLWIRFLEVPKALAFPS